MKNFISIVALLAIILLASSGYNGGDSNIAIGDMAPEIQVSNHTGVFDLDKCSGEYVLLTFWSSSDAQSRIDCNKYNAWFNNNTPLNIKHIAVNFDSQPELFDEIVRLDNFDAKTQYNVNGDQAFLIRMGFGLDNGYGSVLISPDGRVNSFNPSTSDLSSLI